MRNLHATPRQTLGSHALPLRAPRVHSAKPESRARLSLVPGRKRILLRADVGGCWVLLASGLARTGHSPIVVHTHLGAIRRLSDKEQPVDAVLVSLQDRESDIVAFFDFVHDEHPKVRRIAFAQHAQSQESSGISSGCQHDMILWDPWTRPDFLDVLTNALGCDHPPTRSSWSDTRLFESLGGHDPLAIAEIVKRYQYRIGRLALDVTRERADTEDLVQQVYLAIMERLSSFAGPSSPGYWIDQVTRAVIASRSSGGAGYAQRLSHRARTSA